MVIRSSFSAPESEVLLNDAALLLAMSLQKLGSDPGIRAEENGARVRKGPDAQPGMAMNPVTVEHRRQFAGYHILVQAGTMMLKKQNDSPNSAMHRFS